jgi:hypothetical protein
MKRVVICRGNRVEDAGDDGVEEAGDWEVLYRLWDVKHVIELFWWQPFRKGGMVMHHRDQGHLRKKNFCD